ncbi:MAG: hypothetical protein NVSMB65_07170 [Chloroflexota bacterium]
MKPFKKLQENSLYWRYKFITRHWLALKRRARGLRHPAVRPVGHRGSILWVSQASSATWRGRALGFVLSAAVALTVVQMALGPHVSGLGMSLLKIVVVAALVYAFTRSA